MCARGSACVWCGVVALVQRAKILLARLAGKNPVIEVLEREPKLLLVRWRYLAQTLYM